MKDQDLQGMTETALRAEVVRLREGVRAHRDEKGHGRCWLDDRELYRLLPEQIEADFTLPPREEFLRECGKYHELRNRKEDEGNGKGTRGGSSSG